MFGDGKVKKQIGSHGYFAHVRVDCQAVNKLPSSVALDPGVDTAWHRSEGWTDAAVSGAALGLKLAGAKAVCTITQIEGMPADSNSTLMAIAAVRAVWVALGFEPEEELAARLDGAILRRSEWSVADLERELGRTSRCT